MVLKAVIGSIVAAAALVGVVSTVPADMSRLYNLNPCLTMQGTMNIGCRPFNYELASQSDEGKAYEEALLLLLLWPRSGGATVTSLEPSLSGSQVELAAYKGTVGPDEIEVAGWKKWLVYIL